MSARSKIAARRRLTGGAPPPAKPRVQRGLPAYMRVRPSDHDLYFDLSDLTGDSTPSSLAQFLLVNSAPEVVFLPDESEIAELRAAPMGGVVKLGIGGGFVTVRRVPKERQASEGPMKYPEPPSPTGSLRESPKGLACVPWVRVTRDPKPYEACIKRWPSASNSDVVYEMLSGHLATEDQEVMLAVLLGPRWTVRGIAELARGGRDSIQGIDFKDVMRIVLTEGATGCVIVHNHPSGRASPSEPDKAFTTMIRSKFESFQSGMFLDHVIVGLGQYYSFAENGWTGGGWPRSDKGKVLVGANEANESRRVALLWDRWDKSTWVASTDDRKYRIVKQVGSREGFALDRWIDGGAWEELDVFPTVTQAKQYAQKDASGSSGSVTFKFPNAHKAHDFFDQLQRLGVSGSGPDDGYPYVTVSDASDVEAVRIEARKHEGVEIERAPQRDLDEAHGPSACPDGTCKPFARVERDPEAYKRCMARAAQIGPITTPRAVYDLVHGDLEKLDTERFVIVGADIHGTLRCYTQIAQGQRHKVTCDIDELLQVLAIDRPDLFAVVHNHPSNDASPSDADKELTKIIKKRTGEMFDGIKFIDHVIVGHGEFYSFAEGKKTKVK